MKSPEARANSAGFVTVVWAGEFAESVWKVRQTTEPRRIWSFGWFRSVVQQTSGVGTAGVSGSTAGICLGLKNIFGLGKALGQVQNSVLKRLNEFLESGRGKMKTKEKWNSDRIPKVILSEFKN